MSAYVSTHRFRVACLLLLPAMLAGAEARLHLKTLANGAKRTQRERQAGTLKRRPFSRLHIVFQFRNFPQDSEVLELKNRGTHLVGYLPDSGLLATAEENTPLEGLDLVAARPLRPEEKVSPLIEAATEAFIVEFHPDVEIWEAYALVREAGFQPHFHPDLLPNHLLIEGAAARAAALSEWDEVAYVYPASEDLRKGERVHACGGAFTRYGPVGQIATHVGEGWDGEGAGAADLGYYLGQLASRLPRLAAQNEILRALNEWSKSVQVNFRPVASPYAERTLSILFASGSHGDSFPFDGPGHVLAHTFYPAPPNPEPIAGDMHFDNAESWAIGQDIDLFSVALHEAGHALGLAHSDRPGAVMYPYYRRVTALTEDDLAVARELYAARPPATDPSDPPPPPPPPDPTPPPKPPDPTPPKPPTRPDSVAPSLAILSPASTSTWTYDAAVALRGTARDNVGVVKVTWEDTLGNGGLATGTTLWQVTVPLRLGTNTLTLRAFDAAGNSAWRSLTVTRKKR
jgi:hypothetical protein